MADGGRAQPPEKPHFLQPVVTDLATNFSIPADFCKYLDGERCQEIKLRSRSRSQPWVVRIEGSQMVDGWEEFVKDNELHVGEFLVFRYEGDMIFDVTVFGPTACEKEYHPLLVDNDVIETLQDNAGIKRRRSYGSSRVGTDCYVGTMKPSYMKSLYFPRGFILANQLKEATSGIFIQDEKGRNWHVELGFKKGTDVVYTHNQYWRPFVKEIGLNEGDDFEVQVISKGTKPVLAIRRLGGEVSKTEIELVPESAKRLNVEVDPAKASKRVSKPANKKQVEFHEHEIETAGMAATKPKESDSKSTMSHRKRRTNSTTNVSVKHFRQTSTWPSIEKSRMIVNIEFVRANNLMTKCGNIILKNLKGESWPAKLRYEKKKTQDTFYIGGGWRDFALGNGLGVGAQFKMEIEYPESEVLTFKLCDYIPGELTLEEDI